MVNGYFLSNADLFIEAPPVSDHVRPLKPAVLAKDQWPPDYKAIFAWRIETLEKLKSNKEMFLSAEAYYKTHPAEFIMHWLDTYNPRKGNLKWVPFVLFQRQHEFIQFLEDLRQSDENGLVEKCRDIGATWLACAYSVWCWRFLDGDATGWGSRKQALVDKIGDPDSIFEKIRLLIKRMPALWLPAGYKPRDHSSQEKIINPQGGGTITGESGDNIGRGGRKSRYFKDESAHYERPEKIEAALGDNTNVQIDMSSVNGLGNVFHRRREAGIDWFPGRNIEPGYTRVFVFDWRDHPEKTQEWYDIRKAKFEREGMQHIFAQEVDRNYSAAVQNTIIQYEWIEAAVDAHLKIPCLRVPPPDEWMAGLDVADDGDDRNALAVRQWIILRHLDEWGERDPGLTTRRMLTAVKAHKGIEVQYDCVGIGSSVKSEYNRLIDDEIISREDCDLVPWNAGARTINPFNRVIPDDAESALNRDFFANMKAQAWWSIRTRFYKTWRAAKHGEEYPADDLISLDSEIPLLHLLMKELAQPTQGSSTKLRMMVNKKPSGTRSPNLADAAIQAYFPASAGGAEPIIGTYGG